MADERSVVPSLRNMALTIARFRVWPARTSSSSSFVTFAKIVLWGNLGEGQQTAPKSFFWDVNLDETGYRETYAGIRGKRVLEGCFRARAAALQVWLSSELEWPPRAAWPELAADATQVAAVSGDASYPMG